jgi:outer membrane protein assembly factor BamB
LVACFDAASGDSVWTFTYPATYQDDFGFDDGPRATPAIADRRVYTLSPDGLLHCLEFSAGKKVWSVDLKAVYGSQKGFFGIACSPLVEGEAVLLNIGGSKGAGVVALNRTDGKLLWKTSNDEASYSSPVVATIAGKRQALFLTREGLLALEPSTGAVQFQYPWHSRNRMSVNAATPVIIGDCIFISASYGTGAALLRPRETGIETVWSGDDLLSNHYATSLEVDGFLYGIHGRTDPGFSPRPQLRCVELKNHRVCWQTDAVGTATLTRAGKRLFILTEKGELIDAAASAERFVINHRTTVSSSEVRAFPAVADGFFYFRNKNQLICLDLRGPEPR